MLAGAQEGFGHLHPVAFVLDGVDGRAGGDPAQHGELADLAGGRGGRGPGRGPDAFHQLGLEGRTPPPPGGGLLGQTNHLQRPRPVGQAAQEAAFLQGGDQPMDAGLGGQVERLLHLVEGWRYAGFLDPLMDEHEQLMLLARQHLRRPSEQSKNVL